MDKPLIVSLRKRPDTARALFFNGDNFQDALLWLDDEDAWIGRAPTSDYKAQVRVVVIASHRDEVPNLVVMPGRWIVHRQDGSFTVMDNAEMDAAYERVESCAACERRPDKCPSHRDPIERY